MLIPVPNLAALCGVAPSGVLHVGAHDAEEADAYAAHGWQPVWWVEMLADKYGRLCERFAGNPANHVLHAACWDEDGVALVVHRGDADECSSLLAPKEHLLIAPHVGFRTQPPMRTSRLDTLLPAAASFDFVNLDVQGAELRVLRGLGDRLDGIKWVYSEISTRPLYDGCALVDEMDAFLRSRGFSRALTRMAGPAEGWGDALYVHDLRAPRVPAYVELALRARWHLDAWRLWPRRRRPQ